MHDLYLQILFIYIHKLNAVGFRESLLCVTHITWWLYYMYFTCIYSYLIILFTCALYINVDIWGAIKSAHYKNNTFLKKKHRWSKFGWSLFQYQLLSYVKTASGHLKSFLIPHLCSCTGASVMLIRSPPRIYREVTVELQIDSLNSSVSPNPIQCLSTWKLLTLQPKTSESCYDLARTTAVITSSDPSQETWLSLQQKHLLSAQVRDSWWNRWIHSANGQNGTSRECCKNGSHWKRLGHVQQWTVD